MSSISSYSQFSEEDIRNRLAQHLNQEEGRLLSDHHAVRKDDLPGAFMEGSPSKAAHPAAVLVPLLRIDGDWHVLYIRRSEFPGDAHSGQVAFPGGRCQDDHYH